MNLLEDIERKIELADQKNSLKPRKFYGSDQHSFNLKKNLVTSYFNHVYLVNNESSITEINIDSLIPLEQSYNVQKFQKT